MREYIKLCDVCDFQGGSQPPKDEWSFDFKAGYIRMLQIRDFTQSERVAPEYIKITKTTRTCEADDILIARYGASLGKILTGLAGAYNVAIMRTIPNTNILEKKYLYFYLKSPVFQGFLLNVGSRAAQAGFNKNDLQDLFIPNITRNEQVEIVGILERVETVIESRQKELQKLDDLIKARFIEMFGDPVSDTKNWGQTLLKEHLESIRYGTSTPPIFTDDGYAFIRATNIKNGKIVTNDMKYIPQEEADRLEKCKLSGGEIIIVRSGVNAGDTCVVTDEYIGQYAGYDMILVLSSDLHPVFFNTLINTEYMDKVVKPLTRRAAQPHLNSEQTQRLPIIEVPFELQEQFADFVKQVDKSRFDIKKSITELEREVVYD
ncbi:restriction endonuclease subunit S [Holdemanella biformis]